MPNVRQNTPRLAAPKRQIAKGNGLGGGGGGGREQPRRGQIPAPQLRPFAGQAKRQNTMMQREASETFHRPSSANRSSLGDMREGKGGVGVVMRKNDSGKTAFGCKDPDCERRVMPGMSSGPYAAFFKEGGDGPYCVEHWYDDTVAHERPGIGRKIPCSIKVAYDADTKRLIDKIVKDLQQNFRREVTYDEVDQAFKQFPNRLFFRKKCPNCEQNLEWWATSRAWTMPGVVEG